MKKEKDYYKIYKVPRQFEISNHTIKVVFDEHFYEKTGWFGGADFKLDTVFIQPSTVDRPRSKDSVKETFWHEVAHMIFGILRFDDFDDEALIIPVSQAIAQVMKSAVYGRKK